MAAGVAAVVCVVAVGAVVGGEEVAVLALSSLSFMEPKSVPR